MRGHLCGTIDRMTLRYILGTPVIGLYNSVVSRLPLYLARKAYLKPYLGALGRGTYVDRHCRFLNGRRVFLGEGNYINFGCLFDGRIHQDATLLVGLLVHQNRRAKL